MIEYVLIDLDGTLLDFSSGEKTAFGDTIKNFSNYELKEKDYKKFSDINEYYFNEYSKGNMSRNDFHYKRFEEIYKYLKLDCPIGESDKYYIDSLREQAILFPDVLDSIKYLSNKYKLYVASNGMTSVQIKRLEKANILNYFKEIYVSESVGYNKPDLGFFEYVIKDINDFDKSKYIIIGDRLDSDIEGGNNFGIKTVFLDRSKNYDKVDATYHIFDFAELKNIL